MRIRKLASGGAQPFASFTILDLPLPAYSNPFADIRGTTTTTSSKSDDKSSGDIGLLTKDMQKLLAENGLPSDVQYFLSKVDIFGNGIDPNYPGMELELYLKILSVLPEIRHNKFEYDKAVEYARGKGTLDELAINAAGQVYVLTSDGKIKAKNPNKLSKGDYKLTNGLLALIRAYMKPMDKGEFTNVIAGSISIHDVEQNINNILTNIGKVTVNNTGYIKKDSKMGKVIEGYLELIQLGPDGLYKISNKTISNSENIKAFLNYIYVSLSNLEKSVLLNRAIDSGLKGKNKVFEMLAMLIQGKSETSIEKSADYDEQASKAAGYKTDDEYDINKVSSTPVSRFLAGLGDFKQHIFRIGDSTGTYITYGNETIITKDGGKPMGDQLLLSELALSDLNVPGIDLTQASFGGIPILPTDANKILLNGNRVVSADLPYLEINGKIVPIIDKMNTIALILLQSKSLISQRKYLEVNARFRQNGLQPYFNDNGTTTNFYKRFAVILAYADEAVVENGRNKYQIYGEYSDVNDYELGDIVAQLKKRNKDNGIKYTPSRPSFIITLPFTSENIVKSMIFIPISSNAVDWFSDSMPMGTATKIDAASQIRLAQLNSNPRAKYNKPIKNPY